ncbi:hypothetical protein [Desulfobacter latus]|uniref:Uncharacterized protein n=1 Tax=Desulfobacter latus TaxID=2292 RepID=A0A850TG40_9BACT|nr:hypothetical protein [Desulfobacter latus]NWH06446.1 hypothetical protein [Desulfobacter latus]
MTKGFKAFLEHQKSVLAEYGSVGRLPPEAWEPHMFFVRCKDSTLHEFTNGDFQISRENGTHPLFVLSTNQNLKHDCCPCSSKNFNHNASSYIAKGCSLHKALDAIRKDTYILDRLRFPVPVGIEFATWFGGMGCWGVVPVHCVKEVTQP